MNLDDNQLLDAACNFYGSCIGSQYCFDMTVEYMLANFDLDEQEADKIVKAAYQEWVEAYE